MLDAEPRADVGGGGGAEDIVTTGVARERLDPEALYSQGMAHYRRRHWSDARECFQRVKTLQPNRRGIDALLRELDIFLQLESVEEGATSAGLIERPVAGEEGRALEQAQEPASSPRWWLALVVLLTVIVVVGGVLWYSLGLPPFSRDESEQSLRNLGQAYLVAQQHDKALAAYARLIAIVPGDPEALNGLEKAKRELYNEALAYERGNDLSSALKTLERIVEVDPDYKDVASRVENLRLRSKLGELYEEAVKYLDGQAHGQAIRKLLEIRNLAPEYRPGTVSDDLFEAYVARATQHLEHAAQLLKPAPNPKPSEPLYAVTVEILTRIRDARSDLAKALEERPDNQEATLAISLAERLHEGLERYSDWAWKESIVALTEIYGIDPAYLSGKAAAVLCDAHLKLGDFHSASGDYQAALGEYEEMARMVECDPELAGARAQDAASHLTPTPTATLTPSPTRRATNTRRPTFTHTPAPTWTRTATPTPPPQATSQSKPTSQPKEPTPKPTKKSRK